MTRSYAHSILSIAGSQHPTVSTFFYLFVCRSKGIYNWLCIDIYNVTNISIGILTIIDHFHGISCIV
ncbi:hypothetical protein BCR41DRAFT_173529 [Lobosporangium transversale]|uniref:Uncharacterized protein n=1 Tax=Lobosporangium transversale TaxID=64571 RepID=A0A1Y2GAY4_9FUNG|nr:hypothetical protein BCR41DRAFT_173529 [Lobosporangium transversale]ORZ05915.1 hypothetical protein BCR41DRAFT_173529 [Lobosporangium transversale]|eukprot:XP_021877296.1 hypothetical protein BCR41DRAFT_173529 [Lobosporangium transversale]